MKELEKQFFKKNQIKEKVQKKQKVNVKMPHVNIKPIARIKSFLNKETRPRLNCEWIAARRISERTPTKKINVKI